MSVPASLEVQGVKPETYERMKTWGWVDPDGRPATWAYWNSKRKEPRPERD